MEIKVFNCITPKEAKDAIIEEGTTESNMILIKTNKGIIYNTTESMWDGDWESSYFMNHRKLAISDNAVYDVDDCNNRMETLSLYEGLFHGLVSQDYVDYWEAKDAEEEKEDHRKYLEQAVENAKNLLAKCTEELGKLLGKEK